MKIQSSKQGSGVIVLLDDNTDITHLIDLETISIIMDKETGTITGVSLNCGVEGLEIDQLSAGDYSDETEAILGSTTLN